MKLSTIYRLTYIYLAIPLFIFIISWLNLGFTLLFTLLFIWAFCMAYPQRDLNSDENFSHGDILMMAGIAFIWCFFAGIGYFYYQSFDYHFRNAVFRDLINYEWPVFYDKANTPLVYYMAFWLVPAGITKFFSLFVFNNGILFLLGNIILLMYATCGVTLVFTHLACALKVYNKKNILTAIILFILFSGLDVIGHTFFTIIPQPFEYHLEWWATFIQYSSITTGMFWVFNQFIPIALITLLVYNERKISNFGFLAALCLFFSPYPTLGVGLFMIVYAGTCFIQSTDKKKFWLNDIFSVQNIIGAFWLLPLTILYFMTNSEGMDGLHYIFDYTTPQRLILFMILEFLLYIAVLFPQYCKNVFFQTMFISLILIPFLRLDQQNNFCMRASIPAIVILAMFVIRFLFEQNLKHPTKTLILCCLLAIGACTPIIELYRGIYYISKSHKMSLVQDDIHTLNNSRILMPLFGWDVNHQYTARTYKSDIFWQYVSKKLPK